MKLIILCLSFYLIGCTVVSYKDGDSSFTRTSFGTQLQASEIKAVINSDGSRSITVEGYKSDQTEALKAAVQGAVEGAAKSFKPL